MSMSKSDTADDWQNAAEMIRAAGYVHPAEVIEEQAETIRSLRFALRVIARLPVAEQDDMMAANMRKIAKEVVGND